MASQAPLVAGLGVQWEGTFRRRLKAQPLHSLRSICGVVAMANEAVRSREDALVRAFLCLGNFAGFEFMRGEEEEQVVEWLTPCFACTTQSGWGPIMMNVSDVMTRAVKSCGADDNLQCAAEIMWEHDCGVVPIVDIDGRVLGMITDRDICMAAYTQGKRLAEIPVSTAMAKAVISTTEDALIDAAEVLMRHAQVRRLPVLDSARHLTGIVSINDMARHAQRSAGRKANGLSKDAVMQTLAAICEPRTSEVSMESARPSGLRPRVRAV